MILFLNLKVLSFSFLSSFTSLSLPSLSLLPLLPPLSLPALPPLFPLLSLPISLISPSFAPSPLLLFVTLLILPSLVLLLNLLQQRKLFGKNSQPRLFCSISYFPILSPFNHLGLFSYAQSPQFLSFLV